MAAEALAGPREGGPAHRPRRGAGPRHQRTAELGPVEGRLAVPPARWTRPHRGAEACPRQPPPGRRARHRRRAALAHQPSSRSPAGAAALAARPPAGTGRRPHLGPLPRRARPGHHRPRRPDQQADDHTPDTRPARVGSGSRQRPRNCSQISPCGEPPTRCPTPNPCPWAPAPPPRLSAVHDLEEVGQRVWRSFGVEQGQVRPRWPVLLTHRVDRRIPVRRHAHVSQSPDHLAHAGQEDGLAQRIGVHFTSPTEIGVTKGGSAASLIDTGFQAVSAACGGQLGDDGEGHFGD